MAAYTGDGAGTAESPYLIGTFAQLCEMMTCDNRLISYWKLTADIDASASSELDGGAGWTPVGTLADKFRGNFDGDGHTVYNLFINRPTTDYVGFFGFFKWVQSGRGIFRLRLSYVNITGRDYVGGVSGRAEETHYYCHTTGYVTGRNSVGGLVGRLVDWIYYSYSDCIVTGVDRVGGLVGDCDWGGVYYGTFTHCYSAGRVTGTTNVGGFVGAKHASSVFDSCYYDKQTSGRSDTGKGTPKTTVEMGKISTYTSWDFVTVWDMYVGYESIYTPTVQSIHTADVKRAYASAVKSVYASKPKSIYANRINIYPFLRILG